MLAAEQDMILQKNKGHIGIDKVNEGLEKLTKPHKKHFSPPWDKVSSINAKRKDLNPITRILQN